MKLPVDILMEIGGKIPVRKVGGGRSPTDVAALLQMPVRRLIVPDSPADFPQRPGQPVQMEHHSQRELHFVLAGEVLYVVNQRAFLMRPGDLLFIDSWDEHGERPLGAPHESLTAVFHFNKTPWACVNQGPMTPEDFILDDSWIFLPEVLSRFFIRRCREASDKPFGADFPRLLLPAAQAVLDDYARTFAGRVRQRRLAETDPVEKIAVFIRDHSGVGCSNAALSALSGIPVHRLRARYLAHFGVTPQEAIDEARLDLCRFARVNALRQKEIAAALGFSSVQGFNRWMKSKKGLQGKETA